MVILCVDDSAADVRVLQEALKEVGVLSRFLIAQDGAEAMTLLGRGPGRETVRRPDLILLDLNLPSTDGREFLAEIKANPALNSIPVIVLTGSASDEDLKMCQKMGAAYYLVKPVGLYQYLLTAKAIKTFWLERGYAAAAAR